MFLYFTLSAERETLTLISATDSKSKHFSQLVGSAASDILQVHISLHGVFTVLTL